MPKQKHKSAFCAAIVGQRNSGKTFLLSQLLSSKAFKPWNFQLVIIVSPNIHLQNEFWTHFDPKGVVLLKTLDGKVLQRIFKVMLSSKESLLEEYSESETEENEENEETKEKKPDSLDSKTLPHILIITDDLGDEIRQQSDRKKCFLDVLAFAGRHGNVSTISLAQRWNQLSTGVRTQLDFFFWAGSANGDEIRAIYKEFSQHDNVKEFRDYMKEVFNDDFQWLYIQNFRGRLYMEKL